MILKYIEFKLDNPIVIRFHNLQFHSEVMISEQGYAYRKKTNKVMTHNSTKALV